MLFYYPTLAFLWALLLSLYAVPSIIKIAHARNILDDLNHRTIHKNQTPRLGGVAIFMGMFSSYMIFGEVKDGIQYLLAGALVVFLLGAKDDIDEESPFKKFLVQLLATTIVVVMGNIRIQSFHGLFGVYEIPDVLSYGITFFVVIGITNAVNLIDGLDGLAGSITLLISITFGVIFWEAHMPHYAMIGFSLAGGLIGFLRYNVYKAKIFMGDSGALFCGFTVAILSLKLVQSNPIPASPTVAISVLFIPLLDTIRIFLVRMSKGRSPFHPDKNHIHHRLLAVGLPQLGVVAVLVLVNVIVMTVVFASLGLGATNLLYLLLGVGLVFTLILSRFGKGQKQP